MKKANIVINIFRLLFGAVVVLIVILLFLNREKISVETIVNLAPENLLLGAGVFLVLYALKSLSVFFPVAVLQVSVGLIFGPLFGVALNIAGTFTGAAVPYLIGRYSTFSMESLLRKYPKVQHLIDKHRDSDLFLSFFLRILGFLPVDLVSALLGSLKIDFWKYELGTILGMLPGILSATVLGRSIANPGSPEFIFSVTATGVISIGSLIIYLVSTKKKAEKEAE